jgi:hypothetical protein
MASIRQVTNFVNVPPTTPLSPWQAPSMTILQGSALIGWGTVPYGIDTVDGIPAYTYPSIFVTDNNSNTYAQFGRVNDPNTVSDAIQGTQLLVACVAFGLPAGTYTVQLMPGVGTNSYPADWVSFSAAEIVGVTSLNASNSALQTQINAGTNNINCTATATAANCFAVAITFDDEGSLTHPGTPTVGTGLTAQTSSWNMVSGGVNTMCIGYATLGAAGAFTANFNAVAGADSQGRFADYLTILGIFTTTPSMIPCAYI